MTPSTLRYAFFGTGPLAESVLASLVQGGHVPTVVVTKPDSAQGRHMQITAPYIKTWAELKGIDVMQPLKLDEFFCRDLEAKKCDLFIVASYGKIIPEEVLALPKKGVLNVHPSLLPLYRGPSPLESALLDGLTTTGVSIMKLDKEMDHGPILVQQGFTINPLATSGTLEVTSGQLGGALLVQVLPFYLDGSLVPKEQNHSEATFCKKMTKEMGEVTLLTDAKTVQNKFRALTPWPGIYFFITHKGKEIRVKITDVDLALSSGVDSLLASGIIRLVIPEGKKEMDFESFKRGYMN